MCAVWLTEGWCTICQALKAPWKTGIVLFSLPFILCCCRHLTPDILVVTDTVHNALLFVSHPDTLRLSIGVLVYSLLVFSWIRETSSVAARVHVPIQSPLLAKARSECPDVTWSSHFPEDASEETCAYSGQPISQNVFHNRTSNRKQ